MLFRKHVKPGEKVKVEILGEGIKEVTVSSLGKKNDSPIFYFDDDKRWSYVYNIVEDNNK